MTHRPASTPSWCRTAALRSFCRAADIDHIRADYTYTSSYAFESSKLYDFTVAGSTLTVTKTREPNVISSSSERRTPRRTLTLQVPRQTLATITVSTDERQHHAERRFAHRPPASPPTMAASRCRTSTAPP
ncbi:MAG: hypothetical protein ACLRRU_03025 [Faecalibacterium sp.]